MAVLKIEATDGNHEAAVAVSAVRRAFLEYQHALSCGTWADIAQAADALYLAVGRLSAIARSIQ